MKSIIIILQSLVLITLLHFFLSIEIFGQSSWFSLPTYWQNYGYGVGFNIEVFDVNKDNNKDIIIANFNTTDVFYGGSGILDDTVDLTYTGKCIAICDFNGDGFNDLISMHFTNYDSLIEDYDGEILFYWGSDTTEIAIDTVADYSIPIPTVYPQGWNFATGQFKFGTQTGDVNNDGYDDLIISEPLYYDSSHTRVGKIHVLLGKQTPDSLFSYSIQGIINLGLGVYITDLAFYFEVGDLNGDGIRDVLFSARQTTSPPSPQDSLEILYIFYGGDNFDFQFGNESVKYESRVDRQMPWSEWFRKNFSLDDINGDGIDDLVIGGIGLPDQTTNVHYGSSNEIDTIPSFKITDPDTSDSTIWAGGISYNIGDFNNDSYDDFILSLSGFKTFTLHLGGPYVSNSNPFGLRGVLEANSFFPQKAINVGDQNGDGFNDFAVISTAYRENRLGYVIMMLGRDIPVIVENEWNDTPLKEFHLFQSYPNPFNSSTKIKYSIDNKQKVQLILYDVLGNELKSLVNNEQMAGEYEVELNAEEYDLVSGVYFYKLKLEGGEITRKMIYLK
jgi:hypothetical protein